MRVLVTGATGFIGGRLVQMLVDKGHSVVATSRSATRATFPPGVVARDLDITDPGTFGDAFNGVDAVVHTAALVGDWGKREDFFKFDEGGTRNVLAAARAAKVPIFVHTSSIAVYGMARSGPLPEETPRIPTTAPAAYNAAKSAAEGAVEQARAEGYPATIVRPGNVYGPASHHWTVRPTTLISKGLMSMPPGTGPSNTVYVDNVCALLIACLESPAARGETFHVVDEGLQSFHAFFSHYAQAIGKKVPVRPLFVLHLLATVLEAVARVTGKPPLATHEAIDFVVFQGHFPMDKAARVLGFKPPISSTEGMARTVAWLKDHFTR
jgi:nucleoside-diphosphate-sugar epimerase